MPDLFRVAVFGSGAGGIAMAMALTQQGHDVKVYSLYHHAQQNSNQLMLVEEGKETMFSIPLRTTFSATEPIDYACIVCPAKARQFYLNSLVPQLQKSTKIIFIPTSLGFSISNKEVLGQRGWYELNQLPVVARQHDPLTVEIYYRLPTLWCSAYPASQTELAAETIEDLLGIPPRLAKNTLHCGLLNWNMLLHPPLMLANIERIKQQQQFTFYREGVTETAVHLMENLDQERLKVIHALGFSSPTLAQYLSDTTDTTTISLQEALLADPATPHILAPTSIQHRYLTEDIPYNLVPLSHLGKWLHFSMPVADSLIAQASSICQRDFSHEGITAKRMGLESLSLADICSYLGEPQREREKERGKR